MSLEFIPSEADFLELDEITRIQRQYWKQQAAYVRRNSNFYQDYLGDQKLTGDLDEIPNLPFTDKEMLRRDQHRYPAFGSYLAASTEQIIRMHRTSGTTGTAMNLALTGQDARMTAVVGGRAQSAAGLGPQHRVVHCLNYQLWMGGYTDHAALEATGAMVVPYGVGGTRSLIRTIQELGINAISCTPSYPAVLEQVIEKDFPDLSPRDLGLELGLFGGEAGLDDLLFRQKLEDTWGFKVRNSNYGVTDILCNFAGQSTLSNDLHFVALDVLYPELIDPESGNLKPWKAGESGNTQLTIRRVSRLDNTVAPMGIVSYFRDIFEYVRSRSIDYDSCREIHDNLPSSLLHPGDAFARSLKPTETCSPRTATRAPEFRRRFVSLHTWPSSQMVPFGSTRPTCVLAT